MSSKNTSEPRQTSDKQRAANRDNGKKGRGPVTPEGKAIASQNAFKHGGFAKSTLLATESEAVYQERRQGFYDSFLPANRIEAELLDDVVASSWRLIRVRKADTAILSKKVLMAVEQFDLDAEDAFRETLRTLASNPRHVSKTLLGTYRGCVWASSMIGSLLDALHKRGFLYPTERDKLLNIFGLNTEDLFINGFAWDIVRPFIEAGWSTNGDALRVQALIRSPAPEGMSTWEYRHRIETLAAVTSTGDPAAARAELDALLRPEIEKIKERIPILKRREEYYRETAPDRAAIDISPDAQIRMRCESIHRRDYRNALGDLSKYRKSSLDNTLKELKYAVEPPPPVEMEARNEPKLAMPPETPGPPPARKFEFRGMENAVEPNLLGPATHAREAFGEKSGPDWDLIEPLDGSDPTPANIRLFADQMTANFYDFDMDTQTPM